MALKLSKATAKLALNGRHIIFFADERRLSNAVVKPIIIGFLNRRQRYKMPPSCSVSNDIF